MSERCLATCPLCGTLFGVDSRREYVRCEGCGDELSHCREDRPCKMGAFRGTWRSAVCAPESAAHRDDDLVAPCASGVFVIGATSKAR